MTLSTSPASVPSVTERTVREKPVLFSTPMVQAILDRRKTMTRRVVKPQPEFFPYGNAVTWRHGPRVGGGKSEEAWTWHAVDRCPYGQPGDRLWVRETWVDDTRGGFLYRADPFFDGAEIAWKWKPSIFMPRRASRIALEITDVRVERVQEITNDDARSEGVPECDTPGHDDCFYGVSGQAYGCAFQTLWDSINARRGYGWDANPYVWAITFKRLDAPSLDHPHERLGDA